ncbi:MAG: hypothetical protein K2G01_03230, partial [Paramuribaculum sp.]|nr:hypothetical protein [Paramuribaculum sp.]
MAKTKISKAAKDFNISIATLVEFLHKKGIEVANPENPNTRIDEAAIELLTKEYAPDRKLKTESNNITNQRAKTPEKPKSAEAPEPRAVKPASSGPKVIGKIDLATGKPVETSPKPKTEPEKEAEPAPLQQTPKTEPVAVEKPAPVSKPEPVPEPVSKPEPKAETKPAAPAETKPKPVEKPASEPVSKPEPKAESKPEPKAEPKEEAPKSADDNFIPTKVTGGLNINVVGKIDLSAINQTTR